MHHFNLIRNTNRFALGSFAISALEIASFLVGIALVTKFSVPPSGVLRVLSAIWLLGTLVSLCFGLIGLLVDSRKLLAWIAVCVSILTFMACGTQMIV
jgi:hypothetical protein